MNECSDHFFNSNIRNICVSFKFICNITGENNAVTRRVMMIRAETNHLNRKNKKMNKVYAIDLNLYFFIDPFSENKCKKSYRNQRKTRRCLSYVNKILFRILRSWK